MKNNIAKLWVLFIILAVVGSALSGMASAANKSVNLTGDAANGMVNNTLPNEIPEINNTNATANKTIGVMGLGWPDLEVTNKTLEPTEIGQGKSGVLNLNISEVRGEDWAKNTLVYVEILNPDGCYFLESGNNLTSKYLGRIDEYGSKQVSFNLSVPSNATFGNRTINITVEYWETGWMDIGVYGPYYEYASINFTVLTVEDEILDEGNTTIPYMVYMVLHDPNGDGSYSYIEESEKFTIGSEFDLRTSEFVKVEAALDLFGCGFDYSIEVNLSNTTSGGVEINVETTKKLETPSLDEPGAMGPGYGDVFFGEKWIIYYQYINRTTWLGNETDPHQQLIDYEWVYRYWIDRSSKFTKTGMWINENVEEPWKSRVLALDMGFDNYIDAEEANKTEYEQTLLYVGGPSQGLSRSTTLTHYNSFTFSMEVNETMALNWGLDIIGIPLGGKVTVSSSLYIGQTDYTSQEQKVESGYKLSDNDVLPVTDEINTSIYYDKVFGTYLFTTNTADSYTSEPREPWTKSHVNITPTSGVEGTCFTILARMATTSLNKAEAVINHPDETVIYNLQLFDDGAHSDGAAGDRTYGNTWDSTGAEEGLYYVDIVSWDELNNREEAENLATFSINSTPPASITNLNESSVGDTWINWTWVNPTNLDFSHVIVYLDCAWETNTSNNYYNATGLDSNTSYTIATHTVDTNGNINLTWVNGTARTLAKPMPPNISWNATISATNQLEPVTVGMHPNATDNYDDAFDAYAQTPVQGKVIMVLDELYSKSIKKTRCYNELATWELSIGVPTGQTTFLSWSAPSNVTLTVFNGTAILDNGSQLGEGDHSFIIAAELSEKQNYTLNLKAGWNMVSIPVIPGNNSVDAIFGNISTLDTMPVVTWVSPSFVEVEEVEPKIGYWVFTPSDTTITVTGKPITNTTLNLNAGWNMVGTAGTENLSMSSITNQVPQCPSVTWVAPSFVETDIIEPGKSAWVFVTTDTTVTAGKAVPTEVKAEAMPTITKIKSAITPTTITNEWNLTISATNQLEPITFGIHPNATNGYDGYDIFVQTPVQGKAILILDDIYATEINEDKLTWNLSVGIPTGQTTTLTWDSSKIPTDVSLTLDGTDMKSQNSMELGEGSHLFVISGSTGEPAGFDTGSPANPYPSIMGNHTGTIKPNHTVIAIKLYTYPCVGTGGHTEYAEIRNATWNATATWEGYIGDWHNISFDKTVVLLANETYDYTIRTGSYPQIHHTPARPTANGWINCTEFRDANGKIYYDWIPAIKLYF